VIICKKRKYAVLPSHIDSHFTPERPHGFKKQERGRIASRVAEIVKRKPRRRSRLCRVGPRHMPKVYNVNRQEWQAHTNRSDV